MLYTIDIVGLEKLKLVLRERRKSLNLSHLGKHLPCAAPPSESTAALEVWSSRQHRLGLPALPAPTGDEDINITASLSSHGESGRTPTLAWDPDPSGRFHHSRF